MSRRYNRGGGEQARAEKASKLKAEREKARPKQSVTRSVRDLIYWGDSPDDPFAMAAPSLENPVHYGFSGSNNPSSAALAANDSLAKRTKAATYVDMGRSSEEKVNNLILMAQTEKAAVQNELLSASLGSNPVFDFGSPIPLSSGTDFNLDPFSVESVPLQLRAKFKVALEWEERIKSAVMERLNRLGFKKRHIMEALKQSGPADSSQLLVSFSQFLSDLKKLKGGIGSEGGMHGVVLARLAICLDSMCLSLREDVLPETLLGGKAAVAGISQGIAVVRFDNAKSSDGETADNAVGLNAIQRMETVDSLVRYGFGRREVAESLEEVDWDPFLALQLLFDWMGIFNNDEKNTSSVSPVAANNFFKVLPGYHLNEESKLLSTLSTSSTNEHDLNDDVGIADKSDDDNNSARENDKGSASILFAKMPNFAKKTLDEALEATADEEMALQGILESNVWKREDGVLCIKICLKEVSGLDPDNFPRLDERGFVQPPQFPPEKRNLQKLKDGKSNKNMTKTEELKPNLSDDAHITLEIWGREAHDEASRKLWLKKLNPEEEHPLGIPPIPVGAHYALQYLYPIGKANEKDVSVRLEFAPQLIVGVTSPYLSDQTKIQLMKELSEEAYKLRETPAVFELVELVKERIAKAAKKYPHPGSISVLKKRQAGIEVETTSSNYYQGKTFKVLDKKSEKLELDEANTTKYRRRTRKPKHDLDADEKYFVWASDQADNTGSVSGLLSAEEAKSADGILKLQTLQQADKEAMLAKNADSIVERRRSLVQSILSQFKNGKRITPEDVLEKPKNASELRKYEEQQEKLREARILHTKLVMLNDSIRSAVAAGIVKTHAEELKLRRDLLISEGLIERVDMKKGLKHKAKKESKESDHKTKESDHKTKKEKKEKKVKKEKTITSKSNSQLEENPSSNLLQLPCNETGDESDEYEAAFGYADQFLSSSSDLKKTIKPKKSAGDDRKEGKYETSTISKPDNEPEIISQSDEEDTYDPSKAAEEDRIFAEFISLSSNTKELFDVWVGEVEEQAKQHRKSAAELIMEATNVKAQSDGSLLAPLSDVNELSSAAVSRPNASGMDLWMPSDNYRLANELFGDLDAIVNASSNKRKRTKESIEEEERAEFEQSLIELENQLQSSSMKQESVKLLESYTKRMTIPSVKKITEKRMTLPATQMKDIIRDIVQSHRVIVVSGETGCGKSTQVPQILLDTMLELNQGSLANVVCTQPRRLAATAIAERVANERGCKLGDEVGYQIRLESKRTKNTKLLFCTHGILIRQLEGDPRLTGVSHVVVDEVHERSIDSDFLLILLRDLLKRRADLKVVLMSATIQANIFVDYFGGPSVCGAIDIPGRSFPVSRMYLEDVVEEIGFENVDGSPFVRRGGSASRFLWLAKKEAQEESKQSNLSSQATLQSKVSSYAMNKIKSSKFAAAIDIHESMDLVRADAIENRLISELEAASGGDKSYSGPTIRTIMEMDEEKINYDLIAKLVSYIIECNTHEGGSILVFVPGLAEITECMKYLTNEDMLSKKIPNFQGLMLVPLHSALSNEEQRKCFEQAPYGQVKVIVSTNIAETSLTIDDATVVIDAGKMKEMTFDARTNMSSLATNWISQANAKQRAGRAGRVRPGVCYHLFTKMFFDKLSQQQIPEMQRAPLESLCLHIKIMGHGNVEDFLSKAIEPPSKASIRNTMNALRSIQAIEDSKDEKLTPLGFHLASLPVDVRIGKMLLYGCIFRCIDPVLTIAATLSLKSPFVSPLDKRELADEARRKFSQDSSDHFTALHAYTAWTAARARGEERVFTQKHFLSVPTLQTIRDMKRQFTELLSSIGFLPQGLTARKIASLANKLSSSKSAYDDTRTKSVPKYGSNGKYFSDGVLESVGEEFNAFSENLPLVGAVIVAGLYPNIIQVKGLKSFEERIKSETDKKQSSETKETTGSAEISEGVKNSMRKKIFDSSAATTLKYVTKMDGDVLIHPTSVVYNQINLEHPFLVFQQKVKTGKLYVRDVTVCSPHALLLFCSEFYINHVAGMVTLDNWIDLRLRPFIAVRFKTMREHIRSALVQKIQTPEMDLTAVCESAVNVCAYILAAEKSEEERKKMEDIIKKSEKKGLALTNPIPKEIPDTSQLKLDSIDLDLIQLSDWKFDENSMNETSSLVSALNTNEDVSANKDATALQSNTGNFMQDNLQSILGETLGGGQVFGNPTNESLDFNQMFGGDLPISLGSNPLFKDLPMSLSSHSLFGGELPPGTDGAFPVEGVISKPDTKTGNRSNRVKKFSLSQSNTTDAEQAFQAGNEGSVSTHSKSHAHRANVNHINNDSGTNSSINTTQTDLKRRLSRPPRGHNKHDKVFPQAQNADRMDSGKALDCEQITKPNHPLKGEDKPFKWKRRQDQRKPSSSTPQE